MDGLEPLVPRHPYSQLALPDFHRWRSYLKAGIEWVNRRITAIDHLATRADSVMHDTAGPALRVDEIWLSRKPLDMRAGPETALARVIITERTKRIKTARQYVSVVIGIGQAVDGVDVPVNSHSYFYAKDSFRICTGVLSCCDFGFGHDLTSISF